MEDGATLAVCLDKAGKADTKMGLKVFERIRYERVKAVQKTGKSTRNMWHKADWVEVRKNPESMKRKREPWSLDHDAKRFAEKKYDEEVEILKREPKAFLLRNPSRKCCDICNFCSCVYKFV